jgi:PAP2 superfamily
MKTARTWKRIVCTIALLLLILPSFALAADSPDKPAEAPGKNGGSEIPDTDFHNLLRDYGFSLTRGMFSERNIAPFVVGFSGATAFGTLDQQVREAVEGTTSSGNLGQFIGGPAVIWPLVGGSVLISQFTENRKFRAFAYDLTQGALVDETLVRTVKYAVRRTRPNGDKYSFPSGHTSNSFVVATVLDHYYGHRWGIPVYTVAALIGASRISKGKHYLSDTIAGAMIGYLSARTAIHGHTRSDTAPSLSFAPYRDENGTGLGMTLLF